MKYHEQHSLKELYYYQNIILKSTTIKLIELKQKTIYHIQLFISSN